jgi:hypothetical protein
MEIVQQMETDTLDVGESVSDDKKGLFQTLLEIHVIGLTPQQWDRSIAKRRAIMTMLIMMSVAFVYVNLTYLLAFVKALKS